MPTFLELLGAAPAARKSSPSRNIPAEPAFSVGGYGLVGGVPDRSSLVSIEEEAAIRAAEAKRIEDEERQLRERTQLQIDAGRNARRGPRGDYYPEVNIPTAEEAAVSSAAALEQERIADEQAQAELERSQRIQSSPFARMAVVRARAQELIADGIDPTEAMRQADEEKAATDQQRQTAYELQKTRLEPLGQGLREGAEILQRVPGDVASMLARPFDREVADRILASGQGLSQAAEELRTEQDTGTTFGISDAAISRGIGSTGQSVGKMMLAAPVSAVAGPGAGFAAMATLFGADEGNQALFRAEEAGVAGTDRLKYAATQTGIEAGVMSVFQTIPGMAGIESAYLKGVVRQSVGKALLGTGKNLTGEVIEEVTTDILHRVTDVNSGVDSTALDADNLKSGLLEVIGTTALTVGMMEVPQLASAVRAYVADPTRTRFKELEKFEQAKAFTSQVNANSSRRQRMDAAEKLKSATATYEQATQSKFNQERNDFTGNQTEPEVNRSGADPVFTEVAEGQFTGRFESEALAKEWLAKNKDQIKSSGVTAVNGGVADVYFRRVEQPNPDVDFGPVDKFKNPVEEAAGETGPQRVDFGPVEKFKPSNEIVDSLPTDGTGEQAATPAPGVSSEPIVTPQVSGGMTPAVAESPVLDPVAWNASEIGRGDGITTFWVPNPQKPGEGRLATVDNETMSIIDSDSIRKFTSLEQATEWAKAQGLATSEPAVEQEPETQAEVAEVSPAGFKTAKGSSYEVHTDGTTTRNKAARPEHPGESGPQERSAFTWYVTPEDARLLGEVQTTGGGKRTIAETRDGKIGIRYEDGKDKGKFEKRTLIQPQSGPGVGLIPVEVWGGKGGIHFGNEITEIIETAPGATGLRPESTDVKSVQSGEVRQGQIGDKLAEGDVVLTSSGRSTSPFPKFDFSTDRKANNAIKRVDSWLRDNAIAEAKERGDEFNQRVFESENATRMPQATKDSMEAYLFGEQPPVPRSIFRETSESPVGEPQTELSSERPLKSLEYLEDKKEAIRKQFKSNHPETVAIRDGQIADVDGTISLFKKLANESIQNKETVKETIARHKFEKAGISPVIQKVKDELLAEKAARIVLEQNRNFSNVLTEEFGITDIRQKMSLRKLAEPIIEQGRAEKKAAETSPARKRAQERSLAINEPTELVNQKVPVGDTQTDLSVADDPQTELSVADDLPVSDIVFSDQIRNPDVFIAINDYVTEGGDQKAASAEESFQKEPERKQLIESLRRKYGDRVPVYRSGGLDNAYVSVSLRKSIAKTYGDRTVDPDSYFIRPEDVAFPGSLLAEEMVVRSEKLRTDDPQAESQPTSQPAVTSEELGQLLIDNEPQIRKVVSSGIKDQATVDDLVQDVNAKVLEKGWDPAQGEFRKWVSRVARNTRIDHGRKQSASNQVQGDQGSLGQVEDQSAAPLEPDEQAPPESQFDPDQPVTYTPPDGKEASAFIIGPGKKPGTFRARLSELSKSGKPRYRTADASRYSPRELTEEERTQQSEIEDEPDDSALTFVVGQKVMHTNSRGQVFPADVVGTRGKQVIINLGGRKTPVAPRTLSEPEEDMATRIARESGISESDLRARIPQALFDKTNFAERKNELRKKAMARTGWSTIKIRKAEDSKLKLETSLSGIQSGGGDYAGNTKFEGAANDFIVDNRQEFQDVFGDVDPHYYAQTIWDLIEEGYQEVPDARSEEVLQAAADEVVRSQRAAQTSAAEPTPEQGDAWDNFDENGDPIDMSFDFGANVEEETATSSDLESLAKSFAKPDTFEIEGIGKDGKRTVEKVDREEGRKRSIQRILKQAKAENRIRGSDVESFAKVRIHHDNLARQVFDSPEEFGAAAREAFEAEQDAPIEMKGEPAVRTVEPKKQAVENNKAKQAPLFIGKDDLPGQETLFGIANFDKEKGPKGSTNASVDAGLTGNDLPSDVDRGSVETPLKSSTAVADDLMRKVSAHSLPVPELVELATNLMGSPPKVGHRLRKAIGLFKGMDGMNSAEILIRPDIGGDIKQLSSTLAHEIGHLVDWLPDYTMNRGNILGRIGVLNKYLKSMLDAVPTDPSRVLTPKDRRKIRRQAEKFVGPRPPKDEDADLAKWKELVSEKYAEFIEEEAEARKLNRKEWINEELNMLSEWWRPYDPAESDESYVQYRQSSRELYADAMSVMLNAPMEVKKRAPLFWDSWNAYLDRKPEVVDSLIELWERMNGTSAEVAAARRGRLVSGFLKGAEKANAAAQQRLDARESLWKQTANFLSQGLLDKFSPIKQRARKLNAKHTEYLLDELFSVDTPGAVLFLETDEQVLQPLHEAGVTDDMIGEYLFANRIIEEVSAKPKLDKNGNEINDGKGKARFEILNPLGHNPETASQQLNDLRQQIGDEKFKLLQDRIHHWHDQIIWPHVEKARDVGVYSDDVFDRKLEPNKDNYAAFAVVKYLDSDQISPMLSQQAGTFEEIGNPLHFTMAKMWSLSRLNQMNEAKVAVVDRILPAFGEVEQLEVPFGKDRPKGKPKTGNEWMRVLRDGTPVWYEVPEKIARSFDAHDIGSLMQFAKVANNHIYSVAHPLYVTFSPGFLSANPYRDLTRTWTNLGATDGIKLRDVIREWITRGIPDAVKHLRGEQVAIVDEMLREKAFDVPFHSLMAVKEGVLPFTPANEKGRLEVFMEREGNYLAKFMRGLQYLGEVQETATKIAGYRLLTDKGITGKERAYKVRKYVGTPDYKQKGLVTDLSNSMFMYSKVKWNALQVAVELGTGKETAAGYWARALPSAILPAVMTSMAVKGLFGDELEEWWSMVPDYDRENYLIIPAGTREKEGEREAAYFRIPMDENLIFLRKLTMHLWDVGVEGLGGESSKPGLGSAATSAVGAVSDHVLPSWNPGIQIATAWGQYAVGSNPVDDYRNEEIIPRYAWEAGGWDSTRKMVQWTWGKTGVINQFTRFATGALLGSEYSDEEETVLESLLVGAGEATGLRRLFRISSRGKDQSEWVDVEREQQQRQKMLNTVVTPRTRRVNGELARLRGLPDDAITPEKWIRKKVLSLWQARTYTSLVDGVQAADDARRAEIRKELDESVKSLSATIPAEYLDSFVMTATSPTISDDVLRSKAALVSVNTTRDEARAALNASFLKDAQAREDSEAKKRKRKARTLRTFERSDAYYDRLRRLNKLFPNSSN